jgi:hypothetical protein
VVEKRIEQLMNLRYPCIAGSIGIVVEWESRIMKIFEMCFSDNSLSKVISNSPDWWTPTARAKVIVGLVLRLHFLHSLGLVHGHLPGDDVYLNRRME